MAATDILQKQIDKVTTGLEEANKSISTNSTSISVIKQAREDCNQLQKERAEQTKKDIEEAKEKVKKEHDESKEEINKLEKYHDITKKELKDLEKNFNDSQSRFNIVASNVKDLIEFKNKTDDRVSKLIITILAGILLAVAVKTYEGYFNSSANHNHKEVKENVKNISVPTTKK